MNTNKNENAKNNGLFENNASASHHLTFKGDPNQ
jgi:hypothetical protein